LRNKMRTATKSLQLTLREEKNPKRRTVHV